MEDTVVAQPDVQTAPTADEAAKEVIEQDPFAVDENSFVSLTPEQRAALDPVMTKWKESAKTKFSEMEKERDGLKVHVPKAQALDKLVSDQRFIEWYNGLSKTQQTAVQEKPQGISPESWIEAMQGLASNDSTKWNQLLSQWAQPTVNGFQQSMSALQNENAMQKMYASHPDAKDLDQIGRDDGVESPSLLQICANVSLSRGGTWEQGYQLAKSVSRSMENRGKRAALGIVDEKKGAITEKPQKVVKDEGVEYVDTLSEAIEMNAEAQLDGRKVRYAVKK